MVKYPFEFVVVFESSNIVSLELFRNRAWVSFNVMRQQDFKKGIIFLPLSGLNMMPMEAMGVELGGDEPREREGPFWPELSLSLMIAYLRVEPEAFK